MCFYLLFSACGWVVVTFEHVRPHSRVPQVRALEVERARSHPSWRLFGSGTYMQCVGPHPYMEIKEKPKMTMSLQGITYYHTNPIFSMICPNIGQRNFEVTNQ